MREINFPRLNIYATAVGTIGREEEKNYLRYQMSNVKRKKKKISLTTKAFLGRALDDECSVIDWPLQSINFPWIRRFWAPVRFVISFGRGEATPNIIQNISVIIFLCREKNVSSYFHSLFNIILSP